MKGTKKRLLSLLLTVVMLLGMLPAVTVPAAAAETAVAANKKELKTLLASDGDLHITLQPDPDAIPGSNYGKWRSETGSMVVKGNKTIDLNGVNVIQVSVFDEYFPETLFCTVGEGATLTITDSKGGGSISSISNDPLKQKAEYEEVPPVRDLFLVDGGTLIINDGSYVAGNSEDFWVTWGAKSGDTSASSYCGNIHYQTTGSVVTLKNGGTFVANGGSFEGRGYTKYPTYIRDETVRNSTVKADGSGNKIYINAGDFKGMGGADVFSFSGNDIVDVRGGSYSLHYHKRLWTYDSGPYAYYFEASRGSIGLDNFWLRATNVNYLPYVMKAKWNNTVWSGHDTASTKHYFMMTGAYTDGDVITYLPDPYALPGGNLSFNGGTASAEAVWNMNRSAYVSCDVRTYYQQSDTIPDHRLTYTWTIKDGDGNAVSTNRTDTNRLNLSTIWTSGKDELVISCQVEESGPSGTWGYFSKPITVHLSDLPLSEAKLPGGGIDFDVEYGKTTNNDTYYAVVTVRPNQETIENALQCVDSVEYSLAYTDILGQSATAEINHGSYFIIETEAGDTEAILTITLTDIYGNESTFTESVWLLRLPEINVTANTLRMSADGSRYLITAGDASAKLAFDTANMDATRFVGWYQTFKGIVSTDMEFKPTESGIYNYRYYNKDGKLVVSEPVTLDFTDYSSVTKKSADAIHFYAPEDSGKATEAVLTVELSPDFNQVSTPSVQWVLKSYPAGGKYGIKTETLSPTAITVPSGYPVNFSDFLDDSNNFVMPGDYVVQPVITFATLDNAGLTAYGDAVTVTVRKYVDEIKPTANGKVIEEDGVITLPVGESLDLSWVIGKYSEYDTSNAAWYVDTGAYAEDTVAVEGETSGSTYEGNIKLTAQKPGQVKVRMGSYASKNDLDTYMSGGVRHFTVNIPITEFEVTMDAPVENGKSGADYFKVPEGALYTAKTVWLNEQQNAAGKFITGTVCRANVQLSVAEGYALPENLGDITLKINGETVSLDAVEYPSITTEDFRFVYNFGQLVFDKTVIEGQDIEFPIPTVGDAVDQYPDSSNRTALFGETGGIKMFADWLDTVEPNDGDDGNFTNDTSVKVSNDAVYEEGKTYRLTMSTSLYNGYVLGESFVPTVNGSKVEHDFNFGDTSFRAYYYFTPKALVDEILLELPAPAALDQPTNLDMLNDGSSLVYPSTIQWFIDANANGQLDAGEGSAADFNADGSFKANTAYSMMVVMNLYDKDYDGIGDAATFAENITVKHDDESGAAASVIDCTVTKVEDDATLIGICHTFAPTASVAYALAATPNVLTFNVVEGFTSAPAQTFTVESLGSETIAAESLSIFNETGCFEITQNGYEFTVQPMAESLVGWSVGEHEFSVMVRYEDESGNDAYADVAIKLNITEAFVDLKVEPESLTFNCEAGYTSVESQTFRVVDYGNTEFVVSPDTITLRNESMEIDAVFAGDTVTVTPVAGLAEGTYEATLLLMVNDYDILIPVPVTVVVAPRSYYELTSGGGWDFGEGMEQGTTPPDPMPLVVESVGTLLSESVILTASGDTEYFSITLDGEEVDFTDGPVTIPLVKGMAILKWQVINTNDIGSFEAVYTFTCSEDATVSTSRTLSFDVIAPSGVDFNGEHFDTLAEALTAAEAAGGGVVTLKADTTESMLALNGDVTLDLGGHSLTVDAIVNFGGQVVDSSADKSGKIVCPQGMLMLSEDNDDLLVWDGTESYFFTDIDQVLTQVDSGNGTYKVTFLPKFTQLARIKALLADNGGEDNEVSIKVKLMWDGGQKTLTYHDSMVQDVYSGNAFTVTLTNYEAFIEQNLRLQIIVQAGGVVAASDIITVS